MGATEEFDSRTGLNRSLFLDGNHILENRGVGYDLLARLVLETCGPEDADEFIRRLAFVVASGNDDAHLKNWSFQWLGSAPRLSPAYDLVCSIAWDDFGWSGRARPTLA